MNNAIVLKKEVNSHSRPMTHAVTLTADGTWNCTCEHHKYRGAICKHILEVQDELQNEDVAVVVETPQGVELVEVSEIPETVAEIKGVADTDGHVLGGVPTQKIPTTNKVEVEVNDAKALSQLKKALKLKEELLNLKEAGVNVSECLDVVNDLILEI